MPHVVFFGATVAKPVVDWLYDQVEEADAILTLGSSLHVSLLLEAVPVIMSLGYEAAV